MVAPRLRYEPRLEYEKCRDRARCGVRVRVRMCAWWAVCVVGCVRGVGLVCGAWCVVCGVWCGVVVLPRIRFNRHRAVRQLEVRERCFERVSSQEQSSQELSVRPARQWAGGVVRVWLVWQAGRRTRAGVAGGCGCLSLAL